MSIATKYLGKTQAERDQQLQQLEAIARDVNSDPEIRKLTKAILAINEDNFLGRDRMNNFQKRIEEIENILRKKPR